VDYTDHENAKAYGDIVYPVLSRRSHGLSIGINLFTEKKVCNFDCPYCEVFPLVHSSPFSLERLTEELECFIKIDAERFRRSGFIIRDFSFSGNGEPTLSLNFFSALEIVSKAKERCEKLQDSCIDLVLITNSSCFLDHKTAALLSTAQKNYGLKIWAKLDAGNSAWYEKMNNSSLPFSALLQGIASYAKENPITIQTMIAMYEHEEPNVSDIDSYIDRIQELLDENCLIEGVQLYSKARPSPKDSVQSVSLSYLHSITQKLRKAFPSLSILEYL